VCVLWVRGLQGVKHKVAGQLVNNKTRETFIYIFKVVVGASISPQQQRASNTPCHPIQKNKSG